MKILFIATLALLVLLAGVQLGVRAGLDIAAEQAESEYIAQYLLEH